ncbi:hypothetical protein EYF80_022404 [Liparis tanakae]|uniref:Uncharacterized protein n=1 Tax=Liparis tanakae TaxID=230148 RepID=A0A4Z2HNF7_9TELE|nr:hypothetical protein EYF80_022404 [Liparis tanakae]
MLCTEFGSFPAGGPGGGEAPGDVFGAPAARTAGCSPAEEGGEPWTRCFLDSSLAAAWASGCAEVGATEERLSSHSLRSLASSSRQPSLAREAERFIRDGGVSPAWRILASTSLTRLRTPLRRA